MQQTVVILKPDALERNLHWALLRRIEERCQVKPVALGMDILDAEDVDYLYHHQSEQDFYPDMVEYLTRGPVIIALFEGADAIAKVREEVGPYTKDKTGTIRSDHGDKGKPNHVNLIHASDDEDEVAWEAEYFFSYDDEEE